jgi:hypothetical protein
MSDFVAELKTARGLAMAFLAAVVRRDPRSPYVPSSPRPALTRASGSALI